MKNSCFHSKVVGLFFGGVRKWSVFSFLAIKVMGFLGARTAGMPYADDAEKVGGNLGGREMRVMRGKVGGVLLPMNAPYSTLSVGETVFR